MSGVSIKSHIPASLLWTKFNLLASKVNFLQSAYLWIVREGGLILAVMQLYLLCFRSGVQVVTVLALHMRSSSAHDYNTHTNAVNCSAVDCSACIGYEASGSGLQTHSLAHGGMPVCSGTRM